MTDMRPWLVYEIEDDKKSSFRITRNPALRKRVCSYWLQQFSLNRSNILDLPMLFKINNTVTSRAKSGFYKPNHKKGHAWRQFGVSTVSFKVIKHIYRVIAGVSVITSFATRPKAELPYFGIAVRWRGWRGFKISSHYHGAVQKYKGYTSHNTVNADTYTCTLNSFSITKQYRKIQCLNSEDYFNKVIHPYAIDKDIITSFRLKTTNNGRQR